MCVIGNSRVIADDSFTDNLSSYGSNYKMRNSERGIAGTSGPRTSEGKFLTLSSHGPTIATEVLAITHAYMEQWLQGLLEVL